ncbi:MAG TPA: septal ring lytic transglycosylase RlpA family protein [Solirubrobacterales bacterium]|nr:septal ring lytic transglycosylase RlpA family protein [Solirubrobacterales bacterium]
MKRATDRPRRTVPARAAALLPALVASLALLAAPAQATTGGATTIASSKAQTGSGLAFTPLSWAGATWYGPGLYGNSTACGQRLGRRTMGVAHRSLPCGTVVKFVHRGRRVVTRVIDRGPFARGYSWDLTNGVRRALRFDGAGKIRVAVALKYAKRDAGAHTASR